MNKNDYIWILSTPSLSKGFSAVFSLEYHVPFSRMGVAPESLVGSRIWLVVKDEDHCFLFALITPSLIEQYQEGKYKGDFLLHCEPFASIRFLPRLESRDSWKVPTSHDNEGIREASNSELSAFLNLVNKNHRVGFAPPSNTILESVPRTAFLDIEHAVPDQLMSVLRTVAFGDVSRARSMPDSISAIGGIALTILRTTHVNLNETEVVDLLASLDPIVRTEANVGVKTPKDVLKVLFSLPPVVDTFLEEMDPDKISPRTFIAKTDDSSMEWIDKTNDAEKAHEQILKDVALRLKDKGYRIYKSRSFDLFAEKGGTQILWEVKSANGMNSISQGEKGIVQLLRYSVALSSEKHMSRVRFLLLLQDAGHPAVYQYLSKMAMRVGSEVWLYDERKEWPQRVSSADKACAFCTEDVLTP